MPITQSRMIALINAGRDYKQAYEITLSSIQTHFDLASNSEETWAQAFEAVRSHTRPAVLIQNSNSNAVLEVEHAHFRAFRNRNRNAAAKALRKRRDKLAGIMSAPEAEPTRSTGLATTAPQTVIRPTVPAYRRSPDTPDSPVQSQPVGFSQATDDIQVNADSTLDLNAEAQESRDAVNTYLAQLEQKERANSGKG